MENANKALIIAGTILIVLIFLGISIVFIVKVEFFTESFIDSLSKDEILDHNSMFYPYEGEISGIQLNSLLTLVATNNDKSNIKVKLDFQWGAQRFILSDGNLSDVEEFFSVEVGEIISFVPKNRIFSVELVYDEDGVINIINVR